MTFVNAWSGRGGRLQWTAEGIETCDTRMHMQVYKQERSKEAIWVEAKAVGCKRKKWREGSRGCGIFLLNLVLAGI